MDTPFVSTVIIESFAMLFMAFTAFRIYENKQVGKLVKASNELAALGICYGRLKATGFTSFRNKCIQFITSPTMQRVLTESGLAEFVNIGDGSSSTTIRYVM